MNNRTYEQATLSGTRSQSNLLRKSTSNAALEQYQKERGIAGDSKGFVAASLGGQDAYQSSSSQRIIPVLPRDSSKQKKHQYLDRFEAFKQLTLPRLKLRNIIKI